MYYTPHNTKWKRIAMYKIFNAHIQLSLGSMIWSICMNICLLHPWLRLCWHCQGGGGGKSMGGCTSSYRRANRRSETCWSIHWNDKIINKGDKWDELRRKMSEQLTLLRLDCWGRAILTIIKILFTPKWNADLVGLVCVWFCVEFFIYQCA